MVKKVWSPQRPRQLESLQVQLWSPQRLWQLGSLLGQLWSPQRQWQLGSLQGQQPNWYVKPYASCWAFFILSTTHWLSFWLWWWLPVPDVFCVGCTTGPCGRLDGGVDVGIAGGQPPWPDDFFFFFGVPGHIFFRAIFKASDTQHNLFCRYHAANFTRRRVRCVM